MDILSKINWVDILVVILVLRISYASSQLGLSHGIFPLIANILVLVLGLHFYPFGEKLASKYLFKMPPAIADFLSFVGLVIIIGFTCKLINSVLEHILKTEWHPAIERWGGCLVGALKACVIAGIVLTMLALLPLPYLQRSVRDRSFTGMYLLKIGPVMYSKVSKFLPPLGKGWAAPSERQLVADIASDKNLGMTINRRSLDIDEIAK